MRAGVSTACFYPELTERSLCLVAETGARSVEIFVNSEQEFSQTFFGGLGASARSLGVRVVSVHPYTSGFEHMFFFSNYHRRFEDGLELYRRYFSHAASVGAEFFVLHGSFASERPPNEVVFERFLALSEAARQCGVRLLQENVARCRSGSVGFLREMRQALGDSVGFALDIKQALRSGYGPEETLAAMGDRVLHVHMSDNGPAGDCLPPGEGSFDIKSFLLKLAKMGFDGDVILELYAENYDNLEQLTKSFEYLDKITSNIQTIQQNSTQ